MHKRWSTSVGTISRIARVLFSIDGQIMVLLHDFIKKQQTPPKSELDLSLDRLKQIKRKTQ